MCHTKITLEEMYKENDAQQKLYIMKSELCKHALETFEACKHYRNIDKKMCTKHSETYPNEYMRIDSQFTPKVTLYSKELTYNEQITFYLEYKEGFTWDSLIKCATKYIADYERYVKELQEEKTLYTEAIERETKIQALQEEGEKQGLSGTAQKFLPRSYCSKCRYNVR